MEKNLRNFADNQSFLDFAHSSEDIIAQFDANLRHVYVNPAIKKSTGKDPSEFLGKTNEELGMPAENCTIWNQWITSTFESGKPQELEFEFSQEGVASGPRHFHAFSFPIFDDRKNIQYVAVITRDVTEKKIEFSRLLTFSKHAVIGELAGGVAHEIRTPLTIVLGNLEIIRERHSTELAAHDSLAKKLEKVENATHRIAAIINSLMTFARGDPTNSKWEEVFPAHLLETALNITADKFSRVNVQIQRAFEFQESILCKPHLLKEAIQHLLKNSFEAILPQPDSWLNLKIYKNDENLFIEIEDSGVPISTQVQRKMFDPFFSTKEIGSHQGLGLSVARGMIESMNGSLVYNSQSGSSKFIIQLPIKRSMEF